MSDYHGDENRVKGVSHLHQFVQGQSISRLQQEVDTELVLESANEVINIVELAVGEVLECLLLVLEVLELLPIIKV